jgi:hypothetical protein
MTSTVMAADLGVNAARPAPSRAEREDRGSGGFDWLIVALSAWFVGGLYLDGWAHIHVPQLETFFTPWHAVLYSGYAALALALGVRAARNRWRGAPWARVVPPGYGLSLLGAALFLAAGLADMVWHELFGIEDGVEGLISPSHLALALGGGLIVTGPLRAASRRPDELARRWLARWPAVLSLVILLSVFTFFTEYASPFGTTWAAYPPDSRSVDHVFLHQAIGLASILIQSLILMAHILYVLRRRPLPVGSLTVMLGVNAALMAIIHDKYLASGPYPLIAAAGLAGVVADLLYWRVRPAPERPGTLRGVAFATPAILYLFYFLALIVTAEVWWSVHLWTGSIILAGGVGWLLSYLMVPAVATAPARR